MNYSGKQPIAKNPVTYSCMLIMAMLLFASTAGFAQKRNTRQGIDTAAILRNKSLSVEDKLVQLALGGPQFQRSDVQNKVNEHQLKKAQKSWLNLLTVSSNYNFGNNLNKTDNPNNVYAPPGLIMGLTIPLGTIFSKGTDIKIQRESLKLSQLNQDVLARDIKADVLSKYLQYNTYTELITMQQEMVVDEEALFMKAKKSSDIVGGTTFEIVNKAKSAFNNEKAKLLNLKLAQDQIKLQIEALIGVSLESVLQGNK